MTGYTTYFLPKQNMAARKAAKRNRKTEEDVSVKIKGEVEKSIYFKTDSDTSPNKKAKLKQEGKSPSLNKLNKSFYDKPAADLAKQLLGKLLYRVLDNGEVLCGRIVETEGYLGENDKACHTFGGKRTARTEPMYMAPGTAYVYIIYGMYNCLNISSQEPGACVLIRGLEPLQGLNSMKSFRAVKRRDGGGKLKDFELTNGPSKLCQALHIKKSNLNTEDMATSDRFWLEDDKSHEKKDITIVTSTRIGIGPHEGALKLLRFYVLGSKGVSVKDKKAETELLSSK